MPRAVAAILPDPLREQGRRRFLGDDLPELTTRDRTIELARLRFALAIVEPDDVPTWLLRRLRVLEAAS